MQGQGDSLSRRGRREALHAGRAGMVAVRGIQEGLDLASGRIERPGPGQTQALAHPTHDRTPVRQQAVVADDRPPDAASAAFRVDHVPEPEQFALLCRHAVAFRQGRRHLVGMAKRQHHAQVEPGQLEGPTPKGKQPAHPRVLEDEKGRPGELFPEEFGQGSGMGVRRRRGEPGRIDGRPVIPAAADLGQEPGVEVIDATGFPMTGGVGGRGAQQIGRQGRAHQADHPRQGRGAGPVHADDENADRPDNRVRQRAFPLVQT